MPSSLSRASGSKAWAERDAAGTSKRAARIKERMETFETLETLTGRSDPDIAIPNSGVIPLQHDRARRAFRAVQRTAGDAGDLRVVQDRGAVEHHGDAPADQRDVECLPFPRGPGRLRQGRHLPEDAAHAEVAGRLP